MGIHISKVYTRSGDGGETRLIGGSKVLKSDLRVEAYGTIDELNTWVGMARTLIVMGELEEKFKEELIAELESIQNELFDVGSLLATGAGSKKARVPFDPSSIERLELTMDKFQKDLPALPSFVLAGGSQENGTLHLCRVVCRRAERIIVALREKMTVDENALKYVNRLSDYFFVVARMVALKMGKEEYLWKNGLSSKKK